MRIGYKLMTEGFGPQEIVRQALAAEQAGFDFVELSDHFHPWLESQGHSGNTWVMLGAIAAKTETIGLVTGVTCPSYRYHPAVVAQQAATLQLISEGRFTLGVGAGERLNEHVIGTGVPAARQRHEALREALEIIRMLWEGGYRSYDGLHLQLEDARVFDLPEELPPIAVAISGHASLELANEFGDGVFAVEPLGELLAGFTGDGPRYAEIPLAWAPDEEQAVQALLEKTRFVVPGWKVMSELPNPVNFDAATKHVRGDDMRSMFACGPDVERHVEVAQTFVDAGFDHLVTMNGGPDPDGFLEFFATELGDRLRALTPAR
ncbi:TIGR03557 family F420-dependent LLM class oxidoreductase [Cellulomonas sp. SG140]|uniref:TIGR03557 family F420-dependent LLM class oxidoreductase n=1 Tax=Cellulomonas sp. SG140 TaxID=2976536 RepID=UPI0021E872C6|nr:TIGR03557 family F420-dependent LLM class oxidoreductase [Cellulomonas sp. SG140]